MKRVKYNKADIDSTVAAAKKLQSDKALYIFATFNGFTIDKQPPPFGQRYIEVRRGGL